MGNRCDYILPDYFGYIAGSSTDGRGNFQHEHPECLLKAAHNGPHLCRFSDGIYIEWAQAEECPEPEECEDYASCQHFDYVEVPLEEVLQRLKQEGPSS